MSQKITVILARANWCGHCQNFEPVYDKSKSILKNHTELKNFDIKFEDYDLANNDVKNRFMLSHFDALNKVEGYPTVFVKISDNNSNSNSNSNSNYHTISHTVVDESKTEKEQLTDASVRFLDNISNLIKSLNSDNKSKFIQTGGSTINYKTSLKEEYYRKKYLKYKSKYLKLNK